MKKLIFTALAALTATASAPAVADRWYLYSYRELAWGFINLDTLTCNQGVCTVWDADVNIEPASECDTQITRVKVDCTDIKARALFTVQYLKGKEVVSADMDDKWFYPIPGTVGNSMAQAVCKPDTRNKKLIFNFDSLPVESSSIQKTMRDLRDKYRKNQLKQ